MTRLAQLLALAAVVVIALSGCERKSGTTEPALEEKERPARPGPQPGDAGLAELAEPKAPPPLPTEARRRGKCKAEYAPRPRRDPNRMCRVHGGVFMMGSPAGEARGDEHPRQEVEVDYFYIDQF